MKDIVEVNDSEDMKVFDTVVPKAVNVLSIQVSDLEYAPEFGVDFRFFLQSQFQFQNESFKAYLVQRLTENQVNVSQVIQTVETLFQKFTYSVGETKNNEGLIL
jgi:hypothetical protein